jgi:hypothetical protein
MDLEAGPLEQRPVVLPARLADPDLRLRAEQPQEICADLQAARAAERLHRNHALLHQRGGTRAEYQDLHRLVVGLQTVDRQVGLGRARLHALLFGASHAFEQRHLAVVAVIHPHPEVDLVGVLVRYEQLRDAQDRILGRHRHRGEQGR